MKVLVTQPFKLNLGIVDGLAKEVEYKAGHQDMPPDHFKHWWAQLHNVKNLEPVPVITSVQAAEAKAGRPAR
jgi:hypothetical protein